MVISFACDTPQLFAEVASADLFLEPILDDAQWLRPGQM